MMAARRLHRSLKLFFRRVEPVGRFGLPVRRPYRVLNPIASKPRIHHELRVLQASITAYHVDNAKHLDEFRIFEVGREIHKAGERQHYLIAALFFQPNWNPRIERRSPVWRPACTCAKPRLSRGNIPPGAPNSGGTAGNSGVSANFIPLWWKPAAPPCSTSTWASYRN